MCRPPTSVGGTFFICTRARTAFILSRAMETRPMADQSLVIVEHPQPQVTAIYMNRPDKRNALNIPMLQALVAAVEAANDDPSVRAIILRGRGPVFCAGLDLLEASDGTKAHESATLVAKI